jgi:hypothetical protein
MSRLARRVVARAAQIMKEREAPFDPRPPHICPRNGWQEEPTLSFNRDTGEWLLHKGTPSERVVVQCPYCMRWLP